MNWPEKPQVLSRAPGSVNRDRRLPPPPPGSRPRARAPQSPPPPSGPSSSRHSPRGPRSGGLLRPSASVCSVFSRLSRQRRARTPSIRVRLDSAEHPSRQRRARTLSLRVCSVPSRPSRESIGARGHLSRRERRAGRCAWHAYRSEGRMRAAAVLWMPAGYCLRAAAICCAAIFCRERASERSRIPSRTRGLGRLARKRGRQESRGLALPSTPFRAAHGRRPFARPPRRIARFSALPRGCRPGQLTPAAAPGRAALATG